MRLQVPWQLARPGEASGNRKVVLMPDLTFDAHDGNEYCASIPHPFVSVMVFWCPHLQRFGGWIDSGTSTHDVQDITQRELNWGPFDTVEDVANLLKWCVDAAALRALRRSE